MTLEQAFEIFRNNLNVAAGQEQQVSERRERLIERLQSTWRPDKIIPIGSWARKTAIPPIKDIDLMLVLTGLSWEQKTPHVILNDLETELRTKYPVTREQPRSIGLRFEDFNFDIVPALARSSGGYHIPDTTDPRGWIFTDPEKHRKLAAESEPMVITIVKMLKSWNVTKKVGLKSFHLEVMVLRALKQKPPSYAKGVQLAFESLARDARVSCGDPGGSDNVLDKYLTTNRDTIVRMLHEAAQRMALANSSLSQAVARDVFGSPFP